MKVRTRIPLTFSIGIVAAVTGLSAPAAYATPIDAVLFQDTGSSVNVLTNGSLWFTCTEPTAGACLFSVQANSVLPAQTSFNIYEDAAHTILRDTLFMSYITPDHEVLVQFDAGAGLTPLLNAVELTATPNIVDVGQIGSTNTFTLPLDVEFQTEDVPEPVSISLFSAGLAGVAALRRRRKAKA